MPGSWKERPDGTGRRDKTLLQRQHMTLCCADQRGECRAKDAVYQPTHWEPKLMDAV